MSQLLLLMPNSANKDKKTEKHSDDEFDATDKDGNLEISSKTLSAYVKVSTMAVNTSQQADKRYVVRQKPKEK